MQSFPAWMLLFGAGFCPEAVYSFIAGMQYLRDTVTGNRTAGQSATPASRRMK
jgi:hypothetical protein